MEKVDIATVKKFLDKNKNADLITTYSYFLGVKFDIVPCVFLQKKKIYSSFDSLVKSLEKENKLLRKTEIIIHTDRSMVNSNTTKVYICPFSGKVFGDNTHKNPQDLIYDWVSKCPENKEMYQGIRVKKFYVSEDPEVIANYIVPVDAPLTKVVYTSYITGKIFNSRESIIEDLRKNYVKFMDMKDIHKQSNLKIETEFLSFIQDHLNEDKIGQFLESLAQNKDLADRVKMWM